MLFNYMMVGGLRGKLQSSKTNNWRWWSHHNIRNFSYACWDGWFVCSNSSYIGAFLFLTNKQKLAYGLGWPITIWAKESKYNRGHVTWKLRNKLFGTFHPTARMPNHTTTFASLHNKDFTRMHETMCICSDVVTLYPFGVLSFQITSML